MNTSAALRPSAGLRRRPALVAASVALAGLFASTLAMTPAMAPTCSLNTKIIADPSTASCGMALVGSLDLQAGGAGQIAVHGTTAAVVMRDAGIVTLVDLTDPTAPQPLGSYDGGTGQAALDHPLDGDVVFTDDGTVLLHARQTSDSSNEGLHVLDVTDPNNPVRTDLALQGGMLRVDYARIGGTELVVTQDAIVGTTIFELVRTALGAKVIPLWVDPLPELKVGGPASADIVLVDEDPELGVPLLYLTDGKTGLRVYDLSDPAAPALLGTWATQGLASIVVDDAEGRTVYAASEYWFTKQAPPELLTLDASDFGAITETARRNLGAFDGNLAWKLGGMELGEDGLTIAHGHAGLVTIDPATGAIVRSTTDLGVRDGIHKTYGFMGWFAMDTTRLGELTLATDAVTGELRVFADLAG